MRVEPITEEQKAAYNAVVTHPLQAYEWGEFREKTGVKVIRRGVFDPSTGQKKLVDGFQLTIHKIPKTNFTIGYLPKGNTPTKEVLEELQKIGQEENCIFIQLEPNLISQIHTDMPSVILNEVKDLSMEKILRSAQNDKFRIVNSAHPLFTKYTFVLDLTKSEEEIRKGMHQKTRYNIRVAEKHGVKVSEDNSDKAFQKYWELTAETTKRQKFYAHTKKYHEQQWETLNWHSVKNPGKGEPGNEKHRDPNTLTSHLLVAEYDKKILTTMLFFVFKDTLYYPYGASSSEHRNTMHSVLTMWEGIKFGKHMGLTKFDMWGSLSENPDPKDPWYGFHRFKQGYGPDLIEFIGSYDLVINPLIYEGYKVADKLRWAYLKLKK